MVQRQLRIMFITAFPWNVSLYLSLWLQVMREVGWVVFDEIHYMRDPGEGGRKGEREEEGERRWLF